MLLKFTMQGKFLQQIGRRDQSGGNKDTKNFKEPADVVVYRKTNEAFVADGYGNRRVIVLDADTGAFKRMWGAFGNAPVDGPQAPPPGTAATPPPVPYAEPGPPQFSRPVHALKVSNDGLLYVSDRGNGRIQVFTIAGKYVNQLFINPRGIPGAVALSPDPQQQFLYVGDSGNSRILVVDRKSLEVVGEFVKKGSLSPHHIATDSKGNIYTAETGRVRSDSCSGECQPRRRNNRDPAARNNVRAAGSVFCYFRASTGLATGACTMRFESRSPSIHASSKSSNPGSVFRFRVRPIVQGCVNTVGSWMVAS